MSQHSSAGDRIATEYAERGVGTGGQSKILSALTFPILTVLAVQLIKDHQFIPLIVIAVLVFLKGTFAMIALICGDCSKITETRADALPPPPTSRRRSE